MAGAAPWSVKGIDPKAREVAKELARRSGVTLGEWLNRVILEDDVPEEVASQADLARPARTPPGSPLRLASSRGPGQDPGRVAQALDRLADRIEASETRTSLAISGIEHAVREAVARIDAAEREQIAVAARIEEISHRPPARGEANPAGPRSAEALRALYGDEVEIPSSGGAELIDEVTARIGERLAGAEGRTTESLEALRQALAALDGRLRVVEGGASLGLDRRLEALAQDLGRRVDEARAEAAAHLGGAAAGPLDDRLARMAAQVAAVESRSARAIDRMGREVLALAEALNRRLQGAEQQSAAAAEQVAADVGRLGAMLEGRLAHAEQAQAEALRRLGEEIGRGAERLSERLEQSERRAAQAIEDVGEQVARVTERMEHRHERLSDDLAERLRQSEERTARFLEEARAGIEARLAAAQARLEATSVQPTPPPVHAFPELLARAEPAPADLEPEPPPSGPTLYDDDEDDFAPIADLEDDAFAADDETGDALAAERQGLSTREVIEQARIAARAAAGPQAFAPPERRPAGRAGGRLFGRLGFRSQLRPTSSWQTALMVAGGAAFLSVAAAGVVLMEGPRPEPEASLSPEPGAPAPRAAVALAPQSLGAAAPTPEIDAAVAPQARAAAYEAAVRSLESGEAGGLMRLKRVADDGYGPAQFYLAKLYETGQFGVLKSPAEARRWTEAAAQGGDRSAMHNLALYYFRGEGGAQNLAEAAAWFRRAAEAGVVDSQYNLGLLYESGSGVGRDEAQAYKWFSIAAAGGDGEARANALALEAKLSPAALASAQKAAQAFRPRGEAAPASHTANGATVAEAQRVLARLGYYRGAVSGAPSSNLTLAIAAYQRDHGLTATGSLDPRTTAKLSVFTR